MPKYFRVDGEVAGLYTAGQPIVVENRSISRVAFNNNFIAKPPNPAARSMVRNVTVNECQHWACSAAGAIFEDVRVTDIRGGGRAPSYLRGCVFSRVVLSGWISGILFGWKVDLEDESNSRRFLDSNLARYESIDWALDITQAKFSIFDCLLGVPVNLIRRNPELHFILDRDSALQMIASYPQADIWRIAANMLLESAQPSVVVVVGGNGKNLDENLKRARSLRVEGLLQ